ncbi:MAG: phospholipase D-like domain-containing protein [candidate division WOR-3 bacterium]
MRSCRVILVMIGSAAMVGFAAQSIRILETAPLGSDLDLADVANAIDVLPTLFAQAESSIHISQMYMLYYPPQSRGRLLSALYDALIAAAQREVRICILLDSATLEQNLSPAYHRIPWLLADVPNITVRACDLRPYSRYPHCMLHAKYCIIDSRTAVLGSHNWSFGAFADNRELSLVVSDTGFCRQLEAVFATDWRASFGLGHDQSCSALGANPQQRTELRLVVTAPDMLRDSGAYQTIEALIDLFSQAESTLDIEVNSLTTRADFGPAVRFGVVDSLLVAAAVRGVKIRLLVDKWAAERELDLFRYLDGFAGLDVKVADIAPLGPNPESGTMHAKLVIADGGRALVGSATFSQRQLLECRNVGALVRDRDVVGQLQEVFQRDWLMAPIWPAW